MTNSSVISATYTITGTIAAPTFSPTACQTSYTDSSVSSATYTIQVATPTFSTAAGAIVTGTAGSSVTVNSGMTLQAVGCLTNQSDSSVSTAAYSLSLANILYVTNKGSNTVSYLNATTGAYINGTLANSSFSMTSVDRVAVVP